MPLNIFERMLFINRHFRFERFKPYICFIFQILPLKYKKFSTKNFTNDKKEKVSFLKSFSQTNFIYRNIIYC